MSKNDVKSSDSSIRERNIDAVRNYRLARKRLQRIALSPYAQRADGEQHCRNCGCVRGTGHHPTCIES